MIKITSKKEALTCIVNAVKGYDKKLNNRHFLIVYQSGNQVNSVCVGFRNLNFLHLTGVRSNLSAKKFYKAAISRKLSEKDFEMDSTGKTKQKLKVLPYLPELFYHNCMIGNFIDSGIYIKADYFIGDTKAVLSVGFRKGSKIDFPITLYNENVKILSRPVQKVLAIFSKLYNEEEYQMCTYLSKGQDEKKLLEKVRNK